MMSFRMPGSSHRALKYPARRLSREERAEMVTQIVADEQVAINNEMLKRCTKKGRVKIPVSGITGKPLSLFRPLPRERA